VDTGRELTRFEGYTGFLLKAMPSFLQKHTASVRCVLFTPDGRQALSGSLDRSLRLWELPAPKGKK
jgi:WD40 repeat protein